MIIDLNKKTVQELRQRCRELLDEGILDATRTEISRAKKAELIEWIEFYDDDEDDLENESGLQHQIIAAKPRTAIESYPTEDDFISADHSTSEEETPLEPDNPEATEDDGSCEYPEDLGWCDCDWNIEDCLGECGGDAIVD